MKIAVVGIGGIGGDIGASLAHHYENSNDVDIYFIARGTHLDAIKQNGLTLKTTTDTIVSHPTLATESAEECGEMDYVIYCTKSYDIESAIKQIKPLIGKDTVVIPILNGVDGGEKMEELLPNNMVCRALAFVVALKAGDGIVEKRSVNNSYLFGDGTNNRPKLLELEKVMRDATINVKYVEDIEYRVWDKFEFISSVATLTTALNITYGDILGSDSLRETQRKMIMEFGAVAESKNIFKSDPKRVERLFEKMRLVPGDSTTSMQRDFWSGKQCEMESLTAYVINEGKKANIETPTYCHLYSIMCEKRDRI